jgi:hypothetical protein
MDGVGVEAVVILRSRLVGSDAATRVDLSWNWSMSVSRY